MMATVSPVENGNNNRSIHGFLDANVYATKKSIAQGMLDVALLTANASQLKYLLQVGHTHEFYTIMVSLISTSIILQILVGAFIVLVGTVNLNKEKNHFRANVLNNMVTIFIFMITVINIIISAFGLGE
ncbi:ninjurin-2-like isoform X3 [Varroa jacobsoni]|uniref:Ninjurin-2 n=1 Tax=Varroa destructor TaxID=109461 RepID=A0A7M7JS36_VARDE|nr:ninjurin-2-like isoform X2 [Varroa destructor]XP_022696048.1 ninjurin-2-like isoform X3 [Varroa jacobsoni]